MLFPETGYGPNVNEWMRDTLELNPVRVVLRVGKEPEVVVAPQAQPMFTNLKPIILKMRRAGT